MIFFLFPVVGMYSFIFSSFFHPLFIFILSSSCHSLYTHHTHTYQLLSQLNSNSVSSLSFLSFSQPPQRNRTGKKRKKEGKTRREYTTGSNTYTHTPTLSFQLSLTRSLSTGRDRNISAQFSSAQLRHQNREKSAATLYFSFLSWL